MKTAVAGRIRPVTGVPGPPPAAPRQTLAGLCAGLGRPEHAGPPARKHGNPPA
jgi:hypothetical protein